MLSTHPAQVRSLLRSGYPIEIGISDASRQKSFVFKVTLGFAAIYLIWGSTYLGIRYAVETIPPFLMMGLRHLTAGTVVYLWARRSAPAPQPHQWGYAAIAGALLFLGGHGILAWGEQKIPSGLAALLCATLPLWIVVVARVKGVEERIGGRVWAGLLLGFAGVALLIGREALGPQGNLNPLAAGAAVLSALLWAVGTIYGKGARLPSSPVLSAAMQMLIGGASLMVASALLGEWRSFHVSAVSGRSGLALLYLIVFGSVIAFTVFTWLLTVSSASRVSTFAYVNPIVAVLIGWAVAAEALGVRTAIAAAVILAGVALVNTRSKKAPAHSPEARERREVSA
jgi:drug/metabolite transporter (DMT)-like permease